MMAFPPLGNSDHVVSKKNAPFHCIAYDYSHADWDSICDHLRDVPTEDIFNLVLLVLLVNFMCGFKNSVYKMKTFKNCKEVKHIRIMIIDYDVLSYVIFDQQLKITFRKSSAPP